MPYKDISIENIVATIDLDHKLELEKINIELVESNYNPSRFPGIIFKPEELDYTLLIFPSGKIVFAGSNNLDEVTKGADILLKKLTKVGIQIDQVPEPKIENIVASWDLEKRFDLNKVAIAMGLENVEYEPEQFPGLIIKYNDPKSVIILFTSGKLICSGTRTTEKNREAYKKLKNQLKDLKII